jgi:hypothetical protein
MTVAGDRHWGLFMAAAGAKLLAVDSIREAREAGEFGERREPALWVTLWAEPRVRAWCARWLLTFLRPAEGPPATRATFIAADHLPHLLP